MPIRRQPTIGERIAIKLFGDLIADIKEASEGEANIQPTPQEVEFSSPEMKKLWEQYKNIKQQAGGICKPRVEIVSSNLDMDTVLKGLVRIKDFEDYTDIEVIDMNPMLIGDTVYFVFAGEYGQFILPYGAVFDMIKALHQELWRIYSNVPGGEEGLPISYVTVMNLDIYCNTIEGKYYRMPTESEGCPTNIYDIIAGDMFGVLLKGGRNYVFLDDDDVTMLITMLRNVENGTMFGRRIDLPCLHL